MGDSSPDRDMIRTAEEMIIGIRDVRSCRITTDEDGDIAEVHVVASTDRQPKMVARDVESVLNAELDLSVDYKKIGVVVVDVSTDESGVKDSGPDDSDAIIEEKLSE